MRIFRKAPPVAAGACRTYLFQIINRRTHQTDQLPVWAEDQKIATAAVVAAYGQSFDIGPIPATLDTHYAGGLNCETSEVRA